MNSKLTIKTPRQIRAVKALLEKDIMVKDLGFIIGALNARQVVMELRRQGFEFFIITRRYTTTDQDGKICRPGEYFIPQEAKSIIGEALHEAEERQASLKSKQLKKTINEGRL